jgi:hypothetical protein
VAISVEVRLAIWRFYDQAERDAPRRLRLRGLMLLWVAAALALVSMMFLFGLGLTEPLDRAATEWIAVGILAAGAILLFALGVTLEFVMD